MVRPRKQRSIKFQPGVYFFKPRGVPLRNLDEVVLERDEVEALKLHDFDNLDHSGAAKKMGVSQPTFGRILDGTYKKVARALVKGMAIKIQKNL